MWKTIAFILAAGTAAAETPLTADQFEAYATGRTLSYSAGGQVFGTEQYLSGRRVLWAFEGGDCQYGAWYPQGDQICFDYAEGEPQCWMFWKNGTGLSARYMNDPSGLELSEVGKSAKPLQCKGPEVGV